MIRRREFISLLGGAAAWPLATHGKSTIPAVGYLSSRTRARDLPFLAAVRAGLKEVGYVEGENVVIEYHGADGLYERLPDLANAIVKAKVSLILAVGGSLPAIAAKSATSTIPIVFLTGSDPITAGIVDRLNRPSGNITGVTTFNALLGAKGFELLHRLTPSSVRTGLLVNPKNPNADAQTRNVQDAARSLSQELVVAKASTDTDIDTAFAMFAREHIGALMIAIDAFFATRSDRLVALSARYAIPATFPTRLYPEVGGLMSYAPSQIVAHQQVGVYAGRILKGERTIDLPVLQPTKFELIINRKTAKALGLEVPPTLLALADEVIE